MMFPSTKTLAPEIRKSRLASAAGTDPISKSNCLTLSGFTPTAMEADNAKFLTKPQLEPSGVSFGHKRPSGLGVGLWLRSLVGFCSVAIEVYAGDSGLRCSLF